MTDNKKLDEKFESSFNVNASVADPEDKGSNARPADKTAGEKESKALTKAQMISGITHAAYKQSHPELTSLYREFFKLQGTNVDAKANRATIAAGGLKEDVASLFEGSDLSEEFKDNATVIFEAALNSAIIEESARLEEEFEARLEEEVSTIMATMTESIEQYIDHAANQWIEENKLQVETGLRADIAESFLGGLKSLFIEHHVEVPDEAVDVVEALTDQVEQLTAKLNESQNEIITIKNDLAEQATAAAAAAEAVARSEALATVAEGLTDTQREKLATLSEDVTFEDIATYSEKLKSISESLIQKKAIVPAATQLNEEVNLQEDKKTGPAIDPIVAAAMSVGKRHRS